MSTYYRRDEWVTDAMGNAISGAQVYVCSQPANTGTIPPTTEVQVYADPLGATPITQPVLTDGYGHAFYYAAPGTYTVVYYSPHIQQVNLVDQSIAPGGVSIPVAINQGGTGAITAPAALANLGAAASGANVDITSLGAIPSTTINSSGYAFNNGTAANTTTIAAAGWKYGTGTFGTTGSAFAQVASQSWSGSGFTGLAMGVQDASDNFALVTTTGFLTNGLVSANFIHCLGSLEMSTGNNIYSDAIESVTPGNPVTLSGQGISGSGSVGVSIKGGGSLGVSLLGFTTYPTQTTVGAAGGASALPATPVGYLPVVIGGTQYLIPYYTV